MIVEWPEGPNFRNKKSKKRRKNYVSKKSIEFTWI
jgi:hypothetical protein